MVIPGEEKGFFLYFIYFYSGTDTQLSNEIIDLIDNHLQYISQKGFYIVLHTANDNVDVNITYNFVSNKVTKLEASIKTYSGDVLTKKEHLICYI